jgi:Ca2+:H+ antiporter
MCQLSDKLKSESHREAWGRDETGWSWNPFAKGHGRRRGTGRAVTDIENQKPVNTPPNHTSTSPVNPTHPNDFNPDHGTERDLHQRLPTTNEHEDVEKNVPDPGSQDPMAESKTVFESEPSEDDKFANETKWKRRYRQMFLEDPVPWHQQVRTVLFPHWYTINWLLLFSPVGIGLHFVKTINPLAPFIINFIAIIPLAGILSFATEEIALRVGEVLGGLLNASFGLVCSRTCFEKIHSNAN